MMEIIQHEIHECYFKLRRWAIFFGRRSSLEADIKIIYELSPEITDTKEPRKLLSACIS